ncbi:hypothetical protein N0457_31780, partial [Pseudomonas aeruginosa]|nr:hypothetical protein [Pseudomonas aeruginosa]
MRLVFATKDLAVAGRSFEGFPLLVGADGWPVEPAQSFLWHTLVESGEALSALTWEAYGRRLFDYFAFLDLLPDFSTTPNLVESVFRAGDGSEKAFYRRADSRLP